MSAPRECARLLRLELTDRVFGVGVYARPDWGDVVFQRPADAVVGLLFRLNNVRT
jgi:hypothetical protein